MSRGPSADAELGIDPVAEERDFHRQEALAERNNERARARGCPDCLDRGCPRCWDSTDEEQENV